MFFWQGRILIPVTGRQTAPLLKWAFCQKKNKKTNTFVACCALRHLLFLRPPPWTEGPKGCFRHQWHQDACHCWGRSGVCADEADDILAPDGSNFSVCSAKMTWNDEIPFGLLPHPIFSHKWWWGWKSTSTKQVSQKTQFHCHRSLRWHSQITHWNMPPV